MERFVLTVGPYGYAAAVFLLVIAALGVYVLWVDSTRENSVALDHSADKVMKKAERTDIIRYPQFMEWSMPQLSAAPWPIRSCIRCGVCPACDRDSTVAHDYDVPSAGRRCGDE
jgi:hypothetical protein